MTPTKPRAGKAPHADIDWRGAFQGRTVVVTGAAGGIGAAISRALACCGARLMLVDIDKAVERIAADCAGQAVRGDVCDAALADRVVTEAIKLNGCLDMLVNAAGVQVRTGALDITEEGWERLLAVNLSAVYRFCRAAAKAMLAARSGAIVNISSLSAQRALTGIVPYGASKAAVSQLTRGLAVELGRHNVRVNAVAPGYVTTPMTEDLLTGPGATDHILPRIPLGRLAQPDDVVPAVLFLLSDAARYITGEVINVDGGYAIT